MDLNSLLNSNKIELAEFLGILLTDGGISFGPCNTEIFFVGTSSELAEVFSKNSKKSLVSSPEEFSGKQELLRKCLI
jgi:hypothetical protein